MVGVWFLRKTKLPSFTKTEFWKTAIVFKGM